MLLTPTLRAIDERRTHAAALLLLLATTFGLAQQPGQQPAQQPTPPAEQQPVQQPATQQSAQQPATQQSAQASPSAAPQTLGLHIRIFNAKTNKPITDEQLNVAFRADQIGSVAMPTDKNGIILLRPGNAATVRILSNFYGDCRPRGELYTDYPLATIRSSGITTGNLCSGITLPPKPGELLLFEVPKTYIPNYPAPPNTNFPHSDENPHKP